MKNTVVTIQQMKEKGEKISMQPPPFCTIGC